MCFIEPPTVEHNKLVVNKQLVLTTLLPFLLNLIGTKSSEMVYLMSKLYFFFKAAQGKEKYDELKMIMCHNKILQLVCWWDDNVALKAEGGSSW